ncbi:MAG TPA: efflux RND transporter periplasmic adaptor subunit [Polyangiales bacterium]|jgi:cobalt-zinc-cadmium efflux system membrane fusion protein|nr:efflux RND transporter periplasmic adaptor subunit [Polyangiales bacterium]
MAQAATVFLLLLAACKEHAPREQPPAPPVQENTAERGHVDEPEHAELPKIIRLPEAVIRDANIQTVPVVREVLPVTMALPGEIVADPDKSARLASPIPGRIESVRFKEGSVVKAGEVLAVIRVPDLGKLRSEQRSAAAKATAARSNAQRLKELLNQRLTAEQTYLDALANAEAVEQEARAAGEQLGALGLQAEGNSPSALTLRAPIAGVVVARNAVIGQPVGADEVLCEIVDLSEAWFLARVFEKDLGRLKLNAVAEVQLNAYWKERFQGTVEYIGRQVDSVARTVTARIRLKNSADRLRVGLFGTAYVSTGEGAPQSAVLVVPRSAIGEVAGKQVVFVQHPDRDYELHEVVVGASAPGKLEIVSGLREGEQVVAEGVFTLKSVVLKGTFAEEE